MVRAIYIGIDPRLTGAAGYSVLAHLEDLVARGIVATDGDPVIGGTYRLAGPPRVIPGWAGRADLKCAIAHPGIPGVLSAIPALRQRAASHWRLHIRGRTWC